MAHSNAIYPKVRDQRPLGPNKRQAIFFFFFFFFFFNGDFAKLEIVKDTGNKCEYSLLSRQILSFLLAQVS